MGAQPPHRSNRSPATIPNAAKVLPYNGAIMVVDREVVGEEVAPEGTLPMEGVTKSTRLMMIQGVAIALTVRAMPITTGENPGTDPNRRHTSPRLIPMTW